MQQWSVSHGLNGFSLRVFDVPWYAVAVEHAYGWLDAATGCRLCGANVPEFLWKVPVGKPKYWPQEEGEERLLENSVAGLLYSISNKVLGFSWNKEKVRHEFHISDEVGKALWGGEPDWWDPEYNHVCDEACKSS